MGGYLQDYGVADERREKAMRRFLLVLAVLAAAAVVVYFQFRSHREERVLNSFIQHLRNKDYDGAYRVWGCTERKPCRDYAKARFLEDWGPKSRYSKMAQMRLGKRRTCRIGIIQTLEYGKDDEILLWVDSRDLVMSFAPWPVCDPHIPRGSIQK